MSMTFSSSQKAKLKKPKRLIIFYNPEKSREGGNAKVAKLPFPAGNNWLHKGRRCSCKTNSFCTRGRRILQQPVKNPGFTLKISPPVFLDYQLPCQRIFSSCAQMVLLIAFQPPPNYCPALVIINFSAALSEPLLNQIDLCLLYMYQFTDVCMSSHVISFVQISFGPTALTFSQLNL